MQIEIHPSALAAAAAAADLIAELARTTVDRHRTFSMALSGGSSPWAMLEFLIAKDIPWSMIRIFQVDERKAPKGDPARNATLLEAILMRSPLPASQLHPMPVNDDDATRACDDYALAIEHHCREGRLDLVQLGLGEDGHTASLLPGSQPPERPVAFTEAYLGHRRMTLSEAPINRARERLWLVTGERKSAMLERLRAGDPTIPAGRIERRHSTLFADAAAADNPETDG